MKHIGGFFELERPALNRPWHRNALALGSGRGCFAAILQLSGARRVFLPTYLCDKLAAVATEAGVRIEHYPINQQLQTESWPEPKDGELLLAVDYFGLQSAVMASLAARHGERFVADRSQAFFARSAGGSWAFCSARKFFGVPDGAYLYPAPRRVEFQPQPAAAVDVRHLINRLAGRQALAYRQARRHEARFDNLARGMSPLTQRLLGDIDYVGARARRRDNFRRLHAALGLHNLLQPKLDAAAVPFCYPLLLPHAVDRELLARQRLYVPTLWPELLETRAPKFSAARQLARCLLPLPVDQRYDATDMDELCERLQACLAPAARRTPKRGG